MRQASRANAKQRRHKPKPRPTKRTGNATSHRPISHYIYMYYPHLRRHEVRVESLSVMQKEFTHDIATVRIRHPRHNFAYHRSGTPVIISWGSNGRKVQKFYGYIHHVRPHHGTKENTLDLVCIGASYKMKNAKQKIYKKMRNSDIARHIVHDYKLRGDIQKSSVLHQQYPTHGKTAWQILVKLAKESGYTMFCNQHTVHFHSRDRDMKRYARSAPQFFVKNLSIHHNQRQVNVFKFVPHLDSSSESVAYSPVTGTPDVPPSGTRTATVLDSTTGNIITVTDENCSDPRKRASSDLSDSDLNYTLGDYEPDFDDFDIIENTCSQDAFTAQQEIQGIQRLTKYKFSATMHAAGNVRVRQGLPIYLHVNNILYQGLWYVAAVTHNVSAKGYTIQAHLLRDSLGSKWDVPTSVKDERPEPDDDGDLDLTPEEQLEDDQTEPELTVDWSGDEGCEGEEPGDVDDPIWTAPYIPERGGQQTSNSTDPSLATGNYIVIGGALSPVPELPCFVKHRLMRFK